MQSELSQCPWCGQQGIFRGDFNLETLGCDTPGCPGERLLPAYSLHHRSDSAEKWNRRASPWRPISEAPEGEVIDIWIASHGVRVANAKFNAQSQTWEVEGDLTLRAYAFEPTHFMPIPKGPA